MAPKIFVSRRGLFLIFAVFSLSLGAIALQYPSMTGTISVLEPISITPPSISFNAFPNQRITFNITVSNRGPSVVFLRINATVIDTPQGGSTADIKFILPNPFVALPGNNVAAITAEVGNGAVPGTYRISIIFSRSN